MNNLISIPYINTWIGLMDAVNNGKITSNQAFKTWSCVYKVWEKIEPRGHNK